VIESFTQLQPGNIKNIVITFNCIIFRHQHIILERSFGFYFWCF